MAVIDPTFPNRNATGLISNDILLIKWDLGNGDVGQRVKGGNFSDQNIHFHGEFGVGGSVDLRGSNMIDPDASNPDHWFVLRAAHDGSVISGVTDFYGAVILESVLWLSPIVTAGDVTTAIECSLKSNKGK